MTNKFIQKDLNSKDEISSKLSLQEQQHLAKLYTNFVKSELEQCREYIQLSQQDSKTLFTSYEYSIDSLIRNLDILQHQEFHLLSDAFFNLQSYELPKQCGNPMNDIAKYMYFTHYNQNHEFATFHTDVIAPIEDFIKQYNEMSGNISEESSEL